MLRIGTTGTETSFLAEKDLPEYARLSNTQPEALSPKPTGSSTEEEDRQLAEALAKSQEDSTPGLSQAVDVVDPSPSSAPSFPEETVRRLEQMGYAQADVIKALQDAGGNAEQAAIGLFVKFLGGNTSIR